ncbi:MAG: murein transglycosylase A [Burkholderiales bacterium]|nr:murein transglycosylase A [Burkholderiales bacterium]
MNRPSASATSISSRMIHMPSASIAAPPPSRPAILFAAALLAACAQGGPGVPAAVTPPVPPVASPAPAAQTAAAPVCPAPAPTPAPAACAPCVCDKPAPPPPRPQWQRGDWSALPGWGADEHGAAWGAFVASCALLRRQAEWRGVCEAAERSGAAGARAFVETRLQPWRRVDADGSPPAGLITGYYEPLLTGSRTRRAPFVHPVYGVPDDLLVIDLGDLRPELKGQRLRGRLDGRRVVPYFTRAELEAGRGALPGRELLYVDDPIDLFFLMIQGSGRVRLDTGQTVRLNYADQNGHPYRSIGRLLIDQGELRAEAASMQGIKAWARANPARLAALLNANPSFVFFRETGMGDGADLPGPLGAQGLPLTAGRSLAVDPAFVPLGSPVWLATTWPNTNRPLQRLMVAQDTGGAIRGANRGDFFWGFGDDAGREAGRMRQAGEIWLLWPADAGAPPP